MGLYGTRRNILNGTLELCVNGIVAATLNSSSPYTTFGKSYKLVAASNASASSKANADYVCDGTADDVQINAAIATLPAAGGIVMLSEGTFTIAAYITPISNVTLKGAGSGATIIKLANAAGGKVIYQPAGGANCAIRDLTLDGNGANQSNGATRNDGSVAHIANVTSLLIENVIVKNSRSGAGLLIVDSTDVKLSHMRMLSNGQSATAGFESDHCYLGDCYNVQVTDYYALSCTDTGLAIEGCQYVTATGLHIITPGAGSQCLSVSTSPTQVAKFVSIGPGILVGGGTTYGFRMGLFGNVGSPSDVTITGLNISSVKFGISIDEGTYVSCMNNDIKLSAIAGAFGYILGAGAALVNVVGGRVYELTFAQGTGIRFEAGCAWPTFTGVDFYGIPTTISGTPPATAEFSNCTSLVTRNSGATSVADGGTVSHGLLTTPTRVTVNASTSGEFVSVTALAATTFTVAIKKHDGTAGTTAVVYWEAEKVY